MTEQDRSVSMITLLVQNTLTLAQSVCVNNAAWDHTTPGNTVAAQGLTYTKIHLCGSNNESLNTFLKVLYHRI